MKPLSELTIDEAEAYRQGFEAGLRAATDPFAPIEEDPEFVAALAHIEPLAEPVGRGFPQCRLSNPSEMCAKCNCWKMMREFCS